MGYADAPEAEAVAARFGVPPYIHKDDFIYEYLLGPDPNAWSATRPGAIDFYFSDGARSAAQMDELVARFHQDYGRRRLTLFEFASGYGCVSRHLAKMADKYDLLACDIHEQAVEFLAGSLAIRSLLSRREPGELELHGKFDVVFALSFFTHMPDRTWGAWLAKLIDCLADTGVLIFTTHGRTSHNDGGRPPLDPDGYWFGGGSEQKDLPLEDYSTMMVTPGYAVRHIERCDHAAIAFFQEAFWWGKQDTYIVRKVFAPSRSEPLPAPGMRRNSPMPAQRPALALPAPLLANARVLPDRMAILPLIPRGGVIAEVGVALGDFSERMIEICEPERFIAIDRFDLHTRPEIWGRPTGELFGGRSHLEFYRERFAEQIGNGKVTVMQGDSAAMVSRLEDASLDVVYIDADHTYESVRHDLATIKFKMKRGGWIIMNDYIMSDAEWGNVAYGVIQATNEFMIAENWEMIYFALQAAMYCDVVLRKSCTD